MKKTIHTLQKIDHAHRITMKTDREFLFLVENGLLLVLRDNEIINQTQYRYAAERLSKAFYRSSYLEFPLQDG